MRIYPRKFGPISLRILFLFTILSVRGRIECVTLTSDEWLDFARSKFSGGAVAKRRLETSTCFVPAVDQHYREYVSLFAPVLLGHDVAPCNRSSPSPAEVGFILVASRGMRRRSRRANIRLTPLEWLGSSIASEMAARHVVVLQISSLAPLASRGGVASLALAALGPGAAWQVMPRSTVVRAGDVEGSLELKLKSFGFQRLEQGQHIFLKGPRRQASTWKRVADFSGHSAIGTAATEITRNETQLPNGLVLWRVPRSGQGWGYGLTAMLSEQLRSSFCGAGLPSATRVRRGVGLDCGPRGGNTGGPPRRGETRDAASGLGPEVVLQHPVPHPFLFFGRRVAVRALLLVLPSTSPAKNSEERSRLFHDFGQWALGPADGGESLASVSAAAVALPFRASSAQKDEGRRRSPSSSSSSLPSSSSSSSQLLTPARAGHQRTSLAKLSEYLAERPDSLRASTWRRWELGESPIGRRTTTGRSSSTGRKEKGTPLADGVPRTTVSAKEVKVALVNEWGRTMSALLGLLHKVVRGAPRGQVSLLGADLVLDQHGKFWLVDMTLFPSLSAAGLSERRAMFTAKVKDVVALSTLWARGGAFPQLRMCPETAVLAADKKVSGGPGGGKCLLEFSEAEWPEGTPASQGLLSPLSVAVGSHQASEASAVTAGSHQAIGVAAGTHQASAVTTGSHKAIGVAAGTHQASAVTTGSHKAIGVAAGTHQASAVAVGSHQSSELRSPKSFELTWD